jgi:hypothetical protein
MCISNSLRKGGANNTADLQDNSGPVEPEFGKVRCI